jgi:hypothetical protein
MPEAFPFPCSGGQTTRKDSLGFGVGNPQGAAEVQGFDSALADTPADAFRVQPCGGGEFMR